MPQYAFSVPILPGKTDAWKQAIAEMNGPRKAEMTASRRRAGLKQDSAWLQHTPHGDMTVVVWETDDVNKAFQSFMTSTDPFDEWFRSEVLVGIHGMGGAAPPPINELLLNYKG
jgi:hypothetical protein